jgi:3-oxoacyl-[acyl-carrier-protein] synthase-3
MMTTDSEQLMHAGIRAGAETFAAFLDAAGWSRAQVDKTFCHQVGAAHRKLMLESLGLDMNIDYATVQWLGNTGSVALPITLALGVDAGHLASGDHVAMLGIGSGINCLMLAVEWQSSASRGRPVPGRSSSPTFQRPQRSVGR